MKQHFSANKYIIFLNKQQTHCYIYIGVISNIGLSLCDGEHNSIRDGEPMLYFFI